jgi:hypothetical protein
MSLTDFLMARITEDEEVAKAASVGTWYSCSGTRRGTYGVLIADSLDDWLGNVAVGTTEDDAEHIATHHPARVLAECDAKRQIIERHRRHLGVVPTEFVVPQLTHRDGCDTLRMLTLPYADHWDYDESWRP